MSQVIFSSKILKMSGGGNSPKTETDEEKKKREIAEASAAAAERLKAAEAKEKTAGNTEQQTPAIEEQQATEGQATTGTQQATTQTPKREGAAVPQVEQNTGYLDFNGVRLTGDNALAQIRGRFSGYKNLSAQTKLNEIISSGGHVSVQGDRVHFYDKNGNELGAKTIGINLPQSRAAKNWAATFHTQKDADLDSWNHFIRGNYIADVKPADPEPVRKDLRYGNGEWFVTNDVDGKKVYQADSKYNADNWDIVRESYNALIDDDFDNKYNIGKYKDSRGRVVGLRDQIDAAGGIDAWIKGAQERMVAGTSTEDDYRILSLFGFDRNGTASGGSDRGDDNGDKDIYWTPDEFKDRADAFKRAGITFTQGDNGTYSISGGDFGDGSENWSLNDYDDLFGGTKYQNGFLINGHLYSYDDAARDYASTINNYVMAGQSSHNWNERYDNMNASGIRFRGDRRYAREGDDYYGAYSMYDPNTTYSADLDSYIRQNNLGGTGVRDVSADFTSDTGGSLADGTVYALTVPGQSDKYGRPIVKYIERDANGKFVDATNKYASKTPAKFSRYNTRMKWGTRDSSGYAVYGQFKSAENGATQNNALLYNPDTGDYILKTKYNPDNDTSQGIKVDASKVGEIIKYIQNNGIWNISNDDLSRTRWTTSDSTGSNTSGSQNPNHNKIATEAGLDPNKSIRTYTRDDWKKYMDAKQKLKLKSGGKIDWNRLQKLQIGGSVAKAGQQVDLTTTADAQHDISKAHTAEEGYTHSEKLRVGAAIADLAGLAVSFVPGLDTVGGLAGVGSTITQLVADREAQKEGRDVGNYVGRMFMNLGMDALSLTPLLGKWAKIPKVSKVVKVVAPTIGKLLRGAAPILGAVGAANAANAFEKFVSGDIKEMTSNDWTDLLNGLTAITGGTAVVGKNVKSARAVTQLSNEGGKQVLKTKLSKEKLDITDPEFTLNFKKNATEDLDFGDLANAIGESKTKTEAKDALKNLFKENKGSLTDDAYDKQIDKLLESLNLKESKGRLGWGNGNGKWYTAGLSRGEARIDPTTGKLANGQQTSFLGELLSPSKTWHREENLEKAIRGIAPERFIAANEAVDTGTYNPREKDMGLQDWLNKRAADKAIATYGAYNPNGFEKFHIENATRKYNIPFGKEWAEKHQTSQWVSPFLDQRLKGRYDVVENPTPTPTTTPTTTPTITPGTTPSGYTRPSVTWKPSSVGEMPYDEVNNFIRIFENAKNFLSKPTGIERTDYEKLVDMINNLSKSMPKAKQDIILNELGALNVLKQGGYIPKGSGGLQVTPNGEGWKVNKAGLMDLTSAIVQNVAMHKGYDAQRRATIEAGKAMQTSPIIQGERFDVSPIARAGEMAKDPYRQLEFNNSDARLNMAGELQRAQKISDINDTVGQKVSDAINAWNTKETARLNTQAAQDAKVADANRAQTAATRSALEKIDAAEINDKWANIWNTYSQQIRQQARDNQNKFAEYQFQLNAKDAEDTYNRARDQALSGLKQAYNADTTENKGTFETWLQNNPSRYQEYLTIMDSDAMKRAKDEYQKALIQYKAQSLPRQEVVYQKSGGKTTTTKRHTMDALEKMAIQGDAYAKRSVLQTNASLDKMLQKLLK